MQNHSLKAEVSVSGISARHPSIWRLGVQGRNAQRGANDAEAPDAAAANEEDVMEE